MVSYIKKYSNLFLDLLPNGAIWNKSIDSNKRKIANFKALEFSRLENRFNDLMDETDPRTATEMLNEWYKFAGLPDDTTPEWNSMTLKEKRNATYNKIISKGGLSKKYFEQLVINLGFQGVEIKEYEIARVDKLRIGGRLNSPGVRSYWNVTIPNTNVIKFRVGSSRIGDRLGKIPGSVLEKTLIKLKPAHTEIIFTYTS